MIQPGGTRLDTIHRSCERCGQEYADGGINIGLRDEERGN